MKHAKNLIAFLKEREQPVGSKFTHISAGNQHGTTGNYFVPPEMSKKFIELIHLATQENAARFSIGEKPDDTGYILIDLDFHYEPPDYVLADARQVKKCKPVYPIDLFEDIAKIYKRKIDLIFDKNSIDADKYGIWFFEKAHPTYFNHEIHDGFHGLIEIAATQETQYYIRNAVLTDIENCLIKYGLRPKIKQTIEDIVDKRIIKNSWMMYGCAKTTSLPYLLTRGFSFKGDDAAKIPQQKITNMLEQDNLTERFSIQGRKQTAEYRNSDIVRDIKKYFDEHISRKNKIIKATKNEERKAGTTLETISKLTKILSCERADARESWLQVGLCLKKLDDSLLDEWIEFSKKSQKYTDGECEQLWSGFREEWLNFSMGSLYYWAKHDNENLFYEIINETIQGLIMKCIKNGGITHYDVATILYHYYKDRYVCADPKQNVWYEFRNHAWKCIPIGYSLTAKIPEQLGNECERMAHDFTQKLFKSTEDNDTKKYKSYYDEIHKYIKSLKNDTFQRSVMSQAKIMFHRELDEFKKLLDTNPYLVACKNGIIDLSAATEHEAFRPGTPDDLCSINTQRNYQRYNPHSKEIQGIKSFLKEVLPRRKVRHHFMKILCSMLYGRNEEEKFYILTGSGGNGKSKLIELFLSAIGDYGSSFNIGLLTQKRGNAAGPNPAMHKLKNVRGAVAAEPEKTEQFNTALMKELSGGDKMSTRTLNQEEEEWMAMFKILLMCNDLPALDSIDDGVLRRLEVIEFIAKFTHNPDPNDPYQFKRNEKLGRKIKKWGDAFLSYLVHYYFEYYLKEKMTPPNAVIKTTRNYEQANDKIKQFMNENLVATKGKSIESKDIAAKFRRWFVTEMGFGVRVPNKKELEEYLAKRFRKEFVNKKLKGYDFIEVEESDEDSDNPTKKKAKDDIASDDDNRAYIYDSDPYIGVQSDYISGEDHGCERRADLGSDSDQDTTFRDMLDRHDQRKIRREEEINKKIEKAKKKLGQNAKVKKSKSQHGSDSETDESSIRNMDEYREKLMKKYNQDASDLDIPAIPQISSPAPSIKKSVRVDSESDSRRHDFSSASASKSNSTKASIKMPIQKAKPITIKASTLDSDLDDEIDKYADLSVSSDSDRKSTKSAKSTKSTKSVKSNKSTKSNKSNTSSIIPEVLDRTIDRKLPKNNAIVMKNAVMYGIFKAGESDTDNESKSPKKKSKASHQTDSSESEIPPHRKNSKSTVFSSESEQYESSDGEGVAFDLMKTFTALNKKSKKKANEKEKLRQIRSKNAIKSWD